MTIGRLTRRSLLLAGGGVLADALLLSRNALALAVRSRASAARLPSIVTGLNAGPGQPPIIARAAWAGRSQAPRVAPEYGAVKLAFVHHTETPNGYARGEVPAILRGIYAFHRYGKGWNDIGYNFVIDRFGRIFEARAGGIDEPVIGAQAGGYNAHSTGIALLGTYSAQPISAAARNALTRLIAWKLSLHGAPVQGRVSVRVTRAGAAYSRFPANALVSLPRIAGHRDADATNCPGSALYDELSSLRALAAPLAPRTARATLRLGAAAPATPAPVSGEPTTPQGPQGAAVPATLEGALLLLDGTPLPGAEIQLQARTLRRHGERVFETTLARAVTDSQGQWSLPVVIATARHRSTALRALCNGTAGIPAAVSDPLEVAGVLTLNPPPAQSPAPQTPPPQPSTSQASLTSS